MLEDVIPFAWYLVVFMSKHAHQENHAHDSVNYMVLTTGGNKFGMLGRMGYVHVDDVARAHILVYETPSAQGRYICSAQETTPQELVDYLARRYPDLPISTE